MTNEEREKLIVDMADAMEDGGELDLTEMARAALAIAERRIREDCVSKLKEKHFNGEPITERDYIQAEAAFNTILASIPEPKES